MSFPSCVLSLLLVLCLAVSPSPGADLPSPSARLLSAVETALTARSYYGADAMRNLTKYLPTSNTLLDPLLHHRFGQCCVVSSNSLLRDEKYGAQVRKALASCDTVFRTSWAPSGDVDAMYTAFVGNHTEVMVVAAGERDLLPARATELYSKYLLLLVAGGSVQSFLDERYQYVTALRSERIFKMSKTFESMVEEIMTQESHLLGTPCPERDDGDGDRLDLCRPSTFLLATVLAYSTCQEAVWVLAPMTARRLEQLRSTGEPVLYYPPRRSSEANMDPRAVRAEVAIFDKLRRRTLSWPHDVATVRAANAQPNPALIADDDESTAAGVAAVAAADAADAKSPTLPALRFVLPRPTRNNNDRRLAVNVPPAAVAGGRRVQDADATDVDDDEDEATSRTSGERDDGEVGSTSLDSAGFPLPLMRAMRSLRDQAGVLTRRYNVTLLDVMRRARVMDVVLDNTRDLSFPSGDDDDDEPDDEPPVLQKAQRDFIAYPREYAMVNERAPKEYSDYLHYKLEISNNTYKFGDRLGSGTYGSVYMVTASRSNRYADAGIRELVKERRVPLVMKSIKTGHKKSLTPREALILKRLRGAPNCVQLIDTVIAHGDRTGFVFPYTNTSYYKEQYLTFTPQDTRHYMRQILVALDAAHSRGIIHMDFKPLNVFIDNRTRELVLGDWGLGIFYRPNATHSWRTQTIYWKAPEVMLGSPNFNYAVDVWSAGATFAGMVFGRFHFFGDAKPHEMVVQWIAMLGSDAFERFTKKYGIVMSAAFERDVLRGRRFPKRDMRTLIDEHNRDRVTLEAIDLIDRMLRFDPEERITARDALQHPYFRAPSASDARLPATHYTGGELRELARGVEQRAAEVRGGNLTRLQNMYLGDKAYAAHLQRAEQRRVERERREKLEAERNRTLQMRLQDVANAYRRPASATGNNERLRINVR